MGLRESGDRIWAERHVGIWRSESFPNYKAGGQRALSVGVLVNQGRGFGGIVGILQQPDPKPESRRGVAPANSRSTATRRPGTFARRTFRDLSAA